MIGYLSGTILVSNEKILILDCGGIGYEVYAPQTILTAAVPGTPLSLWTHLVHRDVAMELFGFVDQSSVDLFRLLIGISGIGPRSALGILDYNTPKELATAISTKDITYLTKVSGIGKKTAEKILIELADKMPDLGSEPGTTQGDVVDALVAMGYSVVQAREAARSVQGDADIKDRIRLALVFLNS